MRGTAVVVSTRSSLTRRRKEKGVDEERIPLRGENTKRWWPRHDKPDRTAALSQRRRDAPKARDASPGATGKQGKAASGGHGMREGQRVRE